MSETTKSSRARQLIALGASTSLLYAGGVATGFAPSPAEAYDGAVKSYRIARTHLWAKPGTEQCTDTVKPLAVKAGELTLGHLPRKLSPGSDDDHIKSVRNSWDDEGKHYQLKVVFKGQRGDIPEPSDVTSVSLDMWSVNGVPGTSFVLAPPEDASKGQDCWQVEKFVGTDDRATTLSTDAQTDYERLFAAKFAFLEQ